MDHYAGIDVSLECSSVCVVDATGRIVCEQFALADVLVMPSIDRMAARRKTG